MVNPNYKEINVAAQLEDDNSILRNYEKMIALRASDIALTKGNLVFLKSHKDILAISRKLGDSQYLVVINLGNKKRKHRLNIDGELMYGNYGEYFDNQKVLRPYEVQVIKQA